MVLGEVATFLAVVTLTTAYMNITSPHVTNWGDWGALERCEYGEYVQGFQLQTDHASPNSTEDETGLNSIRLFCGDPYALDTTSITSTIGNFGHWGRVYSCYPGVLDGFQLKVESDQGLEADDTATNNVRFSCSSLPRSRRFIMGDGSSRGNWTEPKDCLKEHAICGIQTQVETFQGDGDDTMLNNVLLRCCDYQPQPLVPQA